MERGLCWCGCGQPTRLATKTRPQYGTVRGEPLRFIHGHNGRLLEPREPRYVEQDCGYSTPCWVYQGGLTAAGYGRVYGGAGRSAYAHRFMYERFVGPIPAGLDIDHLCRVRACVNPAHMEPVTRGENVRRGVRWALRR